MTFSGLRVRSDRVQALVLVLALTVFAEICSSGEPPAALWDDLAIAAGVRPAVTSTNSLWQLIASALIRFLPAGSGFSALWLMGPLAFGGIVYLFGGVLQMMLPDFLRRQLVESRSHALIRAFLILPIMSLFAMSEPIWRLGHFFTPDTLHFLLGFLGFYGFARFRRTLLRRYAILAYLALGLLCVEEPFGFVELAVVTMAMTRDGIALKNSGDMLSASCATLYAFLQRLLTILSLLAFGVGVFAAGRFFFVNHGLEASGGVGGEAIVGFLRTYLLQVWNAASVGGWLYFLGIGPILLIVATMLLRRALDIEKILDYRHALCYIGLGILAFFQLANFPLLWIWQNNSGPDLIRSSFLLGWLMVSVAFTLVSALMVLMVEVYFRHYERFAGALFHDATDEFFETLSAKRSRRILKLTWVIANSIPYILVLLSLAWRPRLAERGMYAAVRDFVKLAADDCLGSPIAITDGSADAALECEQFRRGVTDFKALSMLAGATPSESFLRRRGEEKGTEDWIALGVSTSAALRDWVRTSSPRATNLTVQLGFELWRNEKLPLPQMGATAGRTDGLSPERRAKLVESARGLGERMLELSDRGAPFVTSDTRLRELWNFALWRLARTARLRADEADARGETALSQSETQFADALDDVNPSYQKVRRHLEWVPRQVHNRFTPREGLQFALRQADFTMASSYARQILAKNEYDFHANFAMGMYYVTAGQYTRAFFHLERAHAANPKDPAALNNLATVELYLGRIDRAREHSEAALALAPGVSEIRRTVERARRETEKAAKASEQGEVPNR